MARPRLANRLHPQAGLTLQPGRCRRRATAPRDGVSGSSESPRLPQGERVDVLVEHRQRQQRTVREVPLGGRVQCRRPRRIQVRVLKVDVVSEAVDSGTGAQVAQRGARHHPRRGQAQHDLLREPQRGVRRGQPVAVGWTLYRNPRTLTVAGGGLTGLDVAHTGIVQEPHVSPELELAAALQVVTAVVLGDLVRCTLGEHQRRVEVAERVHPSIDHG